ncbi:hypothetical protein [Shinella zoogloeoides]|uniref:hypothetical protein n=1 Tax=Shinella zoogloeoides TaxID=352475 RepID=UPI00299D2CA0|nr:hypothetical protein [Shinella zoogloeoides]
MKNHPHPGEIVFALGIEVTDAAQRLELPGLARIINGRLALVDLAIRLNVLASAPHGFDEFAVELRTVQGRSAGSAGSEAIAVGSGLKIGIVRSLIWHAQTLPACEGTKMNVVFAAISASLFGNACDGSKSEVKRSQPFQAQERCETRLQGPEQELEVAQKATHAPSGNQESSGRQ